MPEDDKTPSDTTERTLPKHLQPPATERVAFRDVRGPKDEVIAKIKASGAAEEIKAYLVARVNARKCAGVRLDAQFHDHAGSDSGIDHCSVTKLF